MILKMSKVSALDLEALGEGDTVVILHSRLNCGVPEFELWLWPDEKTARHWLDEQLKKKDKGWRYFKPSRIINEWGSEFYELHRCLPSF